MKIVDYRINHDRTVTIEREGGSKRDIVLGDKKQRKALIHSELMKCVIVKGEKQPEANIISAQTNIIEEELIAPLEVIPETFTRARQSSSFIDLASLTKAFCNYTHKEIARKEARQRELMNEISRAVADRLTSHLSGEVKLETAHNIRKSIAPLPLDVAERVAVMPIEEQITFFPKQLEANNGRA